MRCGLFAGVLSIGSIALAAPTIVRVPRAREWRAQDGGQEVGRARALPRPDRRWFISLDSWRVDVCEGLVAAMAADIRQDLYLTVDESDGDSRCGRSPGTGPEPERSAGADRRARRQRGLARPGAVRAGIRPGTPGRRLLWWVARAQPGAARAWPGCQHHSARPGRPAAAGAPASTPGYTSAAWPPLLPAFCASAWRSGWTSRSWPSPSCWPSCGQAWGRYGAGPKFPAPRP